MKLDAYNTLITMANSLANEETAQNSPFVFAITRPDKKGVSVQTCVDTKSFIELYRSITDAFIGALKSSGATHSAATNLVAMICAEKTAKHYPTAITKDIPDEAIGKLGELLEGLKEALGMEDEE